MTETRTAAVPGGIVPLIATRRLLLRELRRSDFNAYAAYLAERTEPPGPVRRRDAWRMFACSSGSWLLDGVGWWAVELAATNELVGICGAFRREDNPERETTAEDLELGWTIYEPFRRRGFASEAAAAALGYVFETRRATRAIAHIDASNHASVRVSERIGMRHERDVSFYGIKLGLHTVGA